MRQESDYRADNRYVNNHPIFIVAVMAFVLTVSVAGMLRAEQMIPLTVKKGTSLIRIARQFCTSEYHWKEVAKINRLKDPNVILAGTTLHVPLSLLKIEKLSAKVASVFGGVYLVAGDKKLKQVSKGDFILPGETLVTEEDGFTHLVFPDHKYTRISSGSKFTLTYLVRLADKSLKAEFFLEKGRITHSVEKQLEANETFTTRTPVSVTGVRGTEFRLKMDEGTINLIETLEGVVSVDAAGRTVAVRKGEGTKVEEGKAPQKPKKLPVIPAKPIIQEVYRILPVVIPAPVGQGAETFRLRISLYKQGGTTVLEQESKPGERFTLMALPDGDYYGFLTAIDSENFESPPAEPIHFTVRTIPGAPIYSSAMSGKSIFDNTVELGWLESEDAQKFFVQLAKDKDFKEIVEEHTQSESAYTTPELEPGEYFCRVQAIAADGFRSLFSQIDSWKVQAKPSLNALDSSTENGVTLRWSAMGDDTTYDVQIGKDKQFASLLVDEKGVNDSEYTLSEDVEPGTYYVRLRGRLDDGQVSPWTPYQVLAIEQKPFGFIDAAILVVFVAAMFI